MQCQWPTLLLGIAALAGCVATPPQHNYRPESRIISVPSINQPQEVRVGEEMLKTTKAMAGDAIFVPKEMVVSMYTITPGYFRKVGQTEAGEFFFPGGGAEDGRIVQQGIADVPQALAIRAKDGVLCVLTVFNFMACNRPQAAVTFPSAEGFERRVRAEPGPGSSQALIFNGRQGGTLRLLYRASGTDLAVPMSTPVDHDLTASTVIEYRGARLEVLDASDRSIRYRVLRYFTP